MARKKDIDDTSRGRELIHVAARIFYESGFEGATMQNIADELGILKGGLYHYVGSKEDLLYHVIESPHREALDLVRDCKAMGGDVSARLAQLIRGQILKLTKNHVHWHIFLNDYESLNNKHKRKLVEERKMYQGYLLSLIEEGKSQGVFRSDLDPSLTSLAILGMVNWASRWYRPEKRRPPEQIADEFVALIFKGL